MIRRVLIANRGEIARRIIRTARDMGLETAVVFAADERDEPHVREADTAVGLGNGPLASTYLNVDRVVAAACAVGADTLHPGYGFLSESPELAEACAGAGIRFVGPSVDAIRRMAHKVEAKRTVAAAGVPVLPSVDIRAGGAMVGNVDELGFPLLVKASGGGGGRGMRLVADRSHLDAEVAAAQREALSYFGNPDVFLERFLAAPRHIEVQVVGDASGTVLHLLDRECSIQRRHQKVVEEAPAIHVPLAVRERMWRAAVAAAAAVGYLGVGTVEFLVEDGEFYFLEMNTRLQVEHPVTEAVTGLDLVRLQFDVAEGGPLTFGQGEIQARGHALEVRLCAERPRHGYLPSAGRVRLAEWPSGEGIRVDSAVESGSMVSSEYDSLVAKVIAYAPTRAGAAARLRRALSSDLRLAGVDTNADLLKAVLSNEDFLRGATPIDFLDRHPEVVSAAVPDSTRRVHAALAVLAKRQLGPVVDDLVHGIDPGWRNLPSQPEEVTLGCDGRAWSVRVGRDRDTIHIEVDGTAMTAAVHARSPGRIRAEVDGVVYPASVLSWEDTVWVATAHGTTTFDVAPRLPRATLILAPGACTAPLPGVVAAVLVERGQRVREGDGLVVIEAMKVEHVLRAGRGGSVVEVAVAVGDHVRSLQVLAVVLADEEEVSGAPT